MKQKFNARKLEPIIYKQWQEQNVFTATDRQGDKKGRGNFCIMIPPPNITGSLHMGHAFNNTLQDILIRWHRMRGFNTLWQPGQDHAGIATQMVVERDLPQGETRQNLGREKFLKKIWQWKQQSKGTIIEQLKRLGASCDWQRNRFTMDDEFQNAVRKAFVHLYEKGLIYKDMRLVNWDPHFETAISDLEVVNTEINGFMWHFKYPLANGVTYKYIEKDTNGDVILSETRDYISIATTRPETMLGDGAVAVHPDDKRYQAIVGKLVHLPLCNRLIPIIADHYPDPNFGSGAVKITGAHDFNDYQVAKRKKINFYRLMDEKGRMRDDDAPDNLVPCKYHGLDRFKARKQVVKDIKRQDLWIKTEKKMIMQPFGDRSKVVIEPMLTQQWFVDAPKLAGPAIAAVRNGETRIFPKSEEKTYFRWLENIDPWCISRQLWWGHQVPIWYGFSTVDMVNKKGNIKQFCAKDINDIKTQVKHWLTKHNIAFSKVIEVKNFQQATAIVKENNNKIYPIWRDADVLDTWFSSALWPFATLGWPQNSDALNQFYTADKLNRTLVTGFDILFFWIARMMMMGIEMMGKVPFETVYVHPLVRDEKGKKMSKSLGNVLDPLDLIDVYGADAVRFTLTSMAAMGRDLKLSEQRIVGYRNFVTKIWNLARFAEFNGCKSQVDFDVKKVALTLNKWIIGECATLRQTLDAALHSYRFNDYANALYSFIWGRVCDWYVELSKPILLDEDDLSQRETRAVLGWILEQCLLFLHPVMPFITEKIWADIADLQPHSLLACTPWPKYSATDLRDDAAHWRMEWVIALIEQIRSVRVEMGCSGAAKIPLVYLGLDKAATRAFEENRHLIMRLARIESFKSAQTVPKGAVVLAVVGGSFCLPLASVIDIARQKVHLTSSLTKIEKELGGLRARVNNKKFLANAPAAVIAQNQARIEQVSKKQQILKTSYARLIALE